MSNFPEYFTIDEEGCKSLIYFLVEEFEGKTVKIIVEPEKTEKEE